MRRSRIVALALVCSVVVVTGGVGWWRLASRQVSTDDAYVGAQVVPIAARVGGRVDSVAVWEGQAVKRGDVLFRLDAEPYELAVDAARARLAQARETAASSVAAVAAARAETLAQAQLAENATALATRDDALVARGFLSPQAGDTARSAARAAQQSTAAAAAHEREARAAAGAAGEQNAGVQAAEAALAQARLDLAHTVVRAPADGRIAQLTLRPGAMLEADAPQFALVENAHYWVDANFKETDLAQVRVGQRAKVAIDMLPGRTFAGTVSSIGAGAGSAFSLLPPENASGNWVKVTQRVPVRILLDQVNENTPPPVGASATAMVDLSDHAAR
ncbi:MAG: hypothetical protein B7Y26_00780 [Hydrogenophilales bacterium 16-64-46]|nr:MAG: hypothetical protein B7Z32_10180 [Hydrogenophilales bacterium 12-64-13]OYZ07156.1 MAG: hypothetical protein B7Y26_00780 [Hydrogenophilales bacterium 16-64-46]OZA37375.1 MAG: hypothetical protein B7X87_11705 [Hydrogenophilales bacterium 17-64-34]HQT00607.1 HlyD family secretion protein [Thiobacillus sp.]